MKMNDLLVESQLDEFIPLTRQGRAIRRAEKAGAADLKQTVQDLTTEFAGMLGSQGKKFKTATTDDVIQFLKSKKVDTKKIDAAQPMDPKRIQIIFNTLVKDKMGGKNIAGGADNAEQPKTDPKVLKTVYAQTKAAFSKLNMKEKRRLLAALEKDISANAKKPAAAPQAKTTTDTVVDRNFDPSQKLSQYGKVGR